MFCGCCSVQEGGDKTKVSSLPLNGVDASSEKRSDSKSPKGNPKRLSERSNGQKGPSIGIGKGADDKVLQGATEPYAAQQKRKSSKESGATQPASASRPSVNSTGSGSKDKDEPMPFRKNKKQKSLVKTPELVKRGSINCMEKYLSNIADADAAAGDAAPQIVSTRGSTKAIPVTKNNVTCSLKVIRGPDWKYNDEDGGAGQVGTVFDFDPAKEVVTVFWAATNHVGQQYRCGAMCDLLIAPQDGKEKVPDKKEELSRRNSQFMFNMAFQTVIIFDWDDTLFPTTYVRDDMELAWQKLMKDQDLPAKEKAEITRKLDKCADNVVKLLKQASTLGKVILVTLARSPWVMQSSTNFFARVGELIEDMDVPIIYAQTGVQVDYDKMAMASNEEIEKYWSGIKGRAIAKEVEKFYSQYEGQSWKNIISIGDSDFERLGTQAATKNYMKGMKDEADSHVFKVRTKTFKLVDQPTIEELTVEVAMLQKWLPLMVNLDKGFDVNLSSVEDEKELQRIEKTLQGSKGGQK